MVLASDTDQRSAGRGSGRGERATGAAPSVGLKKRGSACLPKLLFRVMMAQSSPDQRSLSGLVSSSRPWPLASL
eukprot:8171242-Alexandrium_andersonii.AAC.1